MSGLHCRLPDTTVHVVRKKQEWRIAQPNPCQSKAKLKAWLCMKSRKWIPPHLIIDRLKPILELTENQPANPTPPTPTGDKLFSSKSFKIFIKLSGYLPNHLPTWSMISKINPSFNSPVRNPQCPQSTKCITAHFHVIHISLPNQLEYLWFFLYCTTHAKPLPKPKLAWVCSIVHSLSLSLLSLLSLLSPVSHLLPKPHKANLILTNPYINYPKTNFNLI